MKKMKKKLINILNIYKMKTGIYLKFFCVIMLASMVCGCMEYPKSEVTNLPFVNKTALNLYIGDEAQITASPSNATFQWSSDNESVARVSQSGVVTAIDEGLATISVASENGKTNVDVRVRIFVPLTDINLSVQEVKLFSGDKAQMYANPVPEDASDVVFTWTSADPDIATVDKNGLITAIARGITSITVSAGDIEKVISVNVIVMEKYDKTGWVAEADSYLANWADGNGATGNGGHPQRAIDGDLTSAWHSTTASPQNQLPHWLRIDMLTQKDVYRVELYLHPLFHYAKTIRLFMSDSPEQAAWDLATELTFPVGVVSTMVELPTNKTGRYLIIYFLDTRTYIYSNLAEVNVYGN
jgi:hypothetical protein